MSTRTRQTVTYTLPALFPDCLPGFTPSAALELPPLTEDTARQVSDRLLAPDSTPGPRHWHGSGTAPTRSAFSVDLTPSTWPTGGTVRMTR